MPELPQPFPQGRHVIVHRWNDELEKRARRCRGCGAWTLSDYCQWCADMCDTTTYRIEWADPGWNVHHDGNLVHHAPSLLEAENWVTRGDQAVIPVSHPPLYRPIDSANKGAS